MERNFSIFHVSFKIWLKGSRACLAVRFTAKSGDPPEARKIQENRFFTKGCLTHPNDEFSEKFQTAFDPPPPHFRKVVLQFFSEFHDRSIVYNGKNLQHKFLD